MQIILSENESMQDVMSNSLSSFDRVLDMAPVEVLYENGEIKDIKFSDRMREILGYSNKDYFPDGVAAVYKFVHPDDVNLILNCIKDVGLGLKEQYTTEFRIRMASGEYLLCKGTGHSVKDCRGNIVGLYGALIDISKDKTVEDPLVLNQKLEHRKILLDYFVKSYSSAYFINLLDDTFDIIHMDHDFADVFVMDGTKADMLDFIKIHVHPQDRDIILQILDKNYIRARLEKESSFSFIIREVYDNVEKTMRGLIVKGDDENHIALGFLDITKDLQNEKNIHAKLEEALTFTNFFLDTYVSAYYVSLDTFSCQTYKRIQELEDNYPIPENYFDSLKDYISRDVHPDDRTELLEIVNPKRMKAILSYKTSFTHVFRDISGGREKKYRLQVIRGNDESHAAFGFIDITSEMMEEQFVQTQLQNALSMAEAANKAKTVFLNNMSHDIRTPMNAIIGYTDLAESHIDNKYQVLNYLSKISQSSNHLLSLINEVLDMSRIESGQMKLDEKNENLYEMVRTLQNIVQADVNAKSLKFFIDDKQIKNSGVLCDKLRINQVLLNIISNAIKYTPAGGSIYLFVSENYSAGADYGTYKFVVKDNGMGMTQEFLNKIYEPFTRVKSSTVSGIQGTGLGMSITKSIVDMMGGNIHIESEPEKGTEVTVNLVLKHTGENGSSMLEGRNINEVFVENDKGEKEIDLTGKKILLVEDNELNREIATEMLTEYGFVLDTAEDGNIAVEKIKNAKSEDYDIILMDIQMPTMNGYDATVEIRKLGTKISTIPIVAMTANAFEEDRKKALEVGMNEHISKPIDFKKLKEVMQKVLSY